MYETRIPEIARSLGPAAEAGLNVGAELMVEAAKARCPVRTGALRDSIHAEPAEGARTRVGPTVYVIAGERPKTYYANFVENGTVHKKEGFTVRARPFLMPAFEATRGLVERSVKDAIGGVA